MPVVSSASVDAATHLLSMGFAEDRVADALASCARVEDALDWLLAAAVAGGSSGVVEARGTAPRLVLSAAGGRRTSLSPAVAPAVPSRRPRSPSVSPASPTAAIDTSEPPARRRRISKGSRVATTSPAASSTAAVPVAELPLERSVSFSLDCNDQAVTCEICTDDCDPFLAVRLPCAHGWYCATCVRRHAEARLATGATVISCPECGAELPPRTLRALLPTELLDKLLARSLDKAVGACDDLWPCPTPNCNNRVALEDGQIPRLSCSFCSKESCLRCGVQPYHANLTCEEHASNVRRAPREKREAAKFEAWMRQTGTRQCPKCKFAISKENLNSQSTQRSECHKMICRNCGTRFCFKCLAVLTDKFTCGCTGDGHGFINPRTGKFVQHLRR
eukprot:gnl/TRDRNA2_/TRDRNA2_168762_c0_seq1.p1 gnl/TRDRNA2_/TRDRNA2_168762_c0~~gnl/TRDRNA2_/TRDRNA2_168762_c0_seq1.p1  ORF type:complete len:410 (+),score=58.90 gnl/TRDRNA2_/TRDRNA2_168762_c0_seq1:60-1232(+)